MSSSRSQQTEERRSDLCFHHYLNLLPFEMRRCILDFYDFSCGKLYHKSDVTVLNFFDMKFGGVRESRWDGDSDTKLTSKQVMRYLYGYFREDKFRSAFLVRRCIKVVFKFSKEGTIPDTITLRDFVPNGTRILHVDVKIIKRSISRDNYIDVEKEDVRFCFDNFPHSIEKLRVKRSIQARYETLWKSTELNNMKNVRTLKTVDIETMDVFRKLNKRFRRLEKLNINLRIEQISDSDSDNSIVFQSVNKLKIYIHHEYSDYEWLFRMFPSVQRIIIVDEVGSRSMMLPDLSRMEFFSPSLFSSLKGCNHLRSIKIKCLRRNINSSDFTYFLHHNDTIKEVFVDCSFPLHSVWIEFENSSLERLNFFHIGVPTLNSITLSMIRVLLSSLKSLKHLGFVQRTFRRPSGQGLDFHSEGVAQCVDRYSDSPTHNRSNQRQYMDIGAEWKKCNILTRRAFSFFLDPNRTFKLESLFLFLPLLEIDENFFLPPEKWKNLETLHLCCKNDAKLISKLPDFHIPIRDFHSTAKFVPAMIQKLSKIPTLRYFTGVRLDEDFIPFFRYKAPQVRVVGICDRFDTVYQRCHHENPIVDPMRRFRFDNLNEESLFHSFEELKINRLGMDSENHSWLMRSVVKWKLLPPYSVGVDWKDYFEKRSRVMERKKLGVVFDDENEIEKEAHERFFNEYMDGIEDAFRDTKTGKLVDGVELSEEQFQNLKNSLTLYIQRSFRNYKIYVSLYSLIGSGNCFNFEYEYYPTFENLTMTEPKRVIEESRTGPVGYNNIDEFSRSIRWKGFVPIFSRNRNENFSILGYLFAPLYTLRKIERGVFGSQIFSVQQLIRFFHYVFITKLRLYSGYSYSQSRGWVLRMAELAYGVSLDYDENGKKREYISSSSDVKITEAGKLDFFDFENEAYHEDVGKQLERLKEKNREDDGDCSVM